MSNIDWGRLPVFLKVVETESITRAAESLRLPKSSVSRTVSALERELETQLLLRTTRHVKLTEAGRRFYERAKAARAALESCRKQGFQVAVAVVDRAGITEVLLRDRYAGPHTVEVAANKAWTALSFRTASSALAQETQPGRPMSGLRNQPRFIAAGGGLPIEGGGSLLGGIGVSGAPGGEQDEACARAGLKGVADLIEF